MIARFVMATVAVLAAAPAIGCAPPPSDTRTQAEVQADVRRQFDTARDLVDLRMVQAATEGRDGTAVVIRSLKNRVRPGTRLRIHTMDFAACGYGEAKRGSNYRMYLSGVPAAYFQPLQADTAAILAQVGVLPPDWHRLP